MRYWGLILLFLLAGCASAPSQRATTPGSTPAPSASVDHTNSARIVLPLPRLTPQSFQGSADLLQRLVISRTDGKTVPEQLIEVMLQIDPAEVRLAGFALGQRVMLLDWDGHDLQVWRHPKLPEQVDAERVLRDVQFVYWPAGAVSSVLRPGWTLDDAGNVRLLSHDGRPVLRVTFRSTPRRTSHAELENYAEGYRIAIDSAEQSPGGRP